MERDESDREAILRRRAVFIASALGGLTLGAGPQAAGGPPGGAGDTTPCETPAGDPDELASKGRFADAARALERTLACDGASMQEPARRALEEKLEAVRAKTATLAIRVAADGGEISLDGVAVGQSPLSDENLVVDAGDHEVVVRFPDGFVQTQRVSLRPQEFTRVVFDGPPDPFPGPCLSPVPCLNVEPCLSPPDRSWRRDRTAFGLGIAPALALRTSSRGDGDARDARDAAFYGALVLPTLHAGSFADDMLDLRLGGLAGVCAASEGALVPLGGFLAAQLNVGSRYSAGLGVSSGYLLVPGRPAPAAGAADPEAGFFVAPEVSPIGLRFGRVETSLRFSWMISPVFEAGAVALAPSFLTTSIAVSYFGYRSVDDDVATTGAPPRH